MKKIIYRQVKTEEDKKLIISLYKQGLSYQKICDREHFSVSTISRICKSAGISRTISESHKIYHCNADYFHVINNEHKAYWLGFLAADGYILNAQKYNNDGVGLSLMRSDKHHIEKFLKDINSDHKIHDYISDGFGGKHPYSRVIIKEQRMVNDLISHGVVRNKTTILKFPTEDQVSNEFIYDYMRGYFDGNGSFKKAGQQNRGYKVNLLSTKEFLKGFEKKLNIHYPIVKSKPWITVNNYQIDFGGFYNVMNIMTPLYENATIYLDRKYARYKEMEEILLDERSFMAATL